MARNDGQTWHAIEEQAYHAFREWAVWLVLRQKELMQHLKHSETATSENSQSSEKS